MVHVFVAIRAVCESQRLLKLASHMASRATHLDVRAQEREFGFRVVELELRQEFFPAGSCVAFLAALLEAAAVRIQVAVGATAELHVLESRRTARRIRFVAFFAGNLRVKSRQRIARLGVIELFRVLPVVYVMTACAVFAELPLVDVFVTALALRGQAEVGLRSVGAFDQRPHVCANVRGRVALLASHSGVLPFQRIPGQPVIELLRWPLPVDEGKILAVVLQVAADAVLAVGIFHLQLGVIAPLLRKQLGNFFVAIQAFERGSAGAKLVAARTLRCSAKRLVRFGERTG